MLETLANLPVPNVGTINHLLIWAGVLVATIFGLAAGIFGAVVWVTTKFENQSEKMQTLVRDSAHEISKPINAIDSKVRELGADIKGVIQPAMQRLELRTERIEGRLDGFQFRLEKVEAADS